MSEGFEFFQVLKENSFKDNYDNINECILEWEIVNHEYKCCGCRHGNKNDEVICIDCICGEKCIYHRFNIINKINKNILVVGSSCVKKFCNNEWYEPYKIKKAEMKKVKKEKELKKLMYQSYLDDPKCEFCFNRVFSDIKCIPCNYTKSKLKNTTFDEMINKINNRKGYSTWLLDENIIKKGDGYHMFNWLTKKKFNLSLIKDYEERLLQLN